MSEASREHANRAGEKIGELIDQLRGEIPALDDERAKALFETGAEVLIGLKTAFEHYQRGEEEAWR